MKELLFSIAGFATLIITFIIYAHIYQRRLHGLLTRKGVFKFIDRFLIIISILGILVTLLWDFNYLRYKAPIEYKNFKTITLNDFRGLNRPFNTLNGDSKFAFISTSIYTNRTKGQIEIKALFHPCRSYVYHKNLFSNELLTHEMYHFHITEYCARLMRKEVQTSINRNKKINLKKIKYKILTLEDELQYQYDDESDHSYVHYKQIEWQNKIDSFLISLDNYSNTTLILKQ